VIAGRTYLERGLPVVVLIGFGPGGGDPDATTRYFPGRRPKNGPRNVLITRADGTRTVRPFRGLRKVKDGAP
jgi:hypothetical protein